MFVYLLQWFASHHSKLEFEFRQLFPKRHGRIQSAQF